MANLAFLTYMRGKQVTAATLYTPVMHSKCRAESITLIIKWSVFKSLGKQTAATCARLATFQIAIKDLV